MNFAVLVDVVEGLFVLGGAEVAERGMQALTVVVMRVIVSRESS